MSSLADPTSTDQTVSDDTSTLPLIDGRAPSVVGQHEQLLYVPDQDEAEPQLSIVIPALNESMVVETFIEWCHEGLKKAGITGEILIIDSSTDDTPALALKGGARVLKVPKRGLGRAYIDAVPFIRGQWVLMGDADCTYDFRELTGFVEAFQAGHDFVMGSRFKGYIEPGASPWLHQYVGTPVTTWILNVIFGSTFSDIHCGMRGITLAKLKEMRIASQSWEYASEMVLKSVHMKLKTAEVPVRFYKDREGRVSHHKRVGWFSPWHAAWINLRAMFIWGADFFCYKPGLVMLILGLVLTVPLVAGPVSLFGITFSLFWMLLGMTLAITGAQAAATGLVARMLYDRTGATRATLLKRFPYDRTVITAIGTAKLGVLCAIPLAWTYVDQGLQLATPGAWTQHTAIFGLMLVAFGFIGFVFTLVLHAAGLAMAERDKP
ncbi:MAG: glycosyltransferase family 2 protein [Pseudomonadota bacterium]